ncbi:MAG TPA: hypothetical protein VFU38_05070, partial [Candidatus Krumholzibacteria bacterium]|nr:hypothetical protein [Candidatus Krumholzibacteria bacterium]
MIRIRVLLLMVALSSLLAGGCSKKETATVDKSDESLAARIGDWTITREYVEEYLRRLPEPQRSRFDSPEGRALLTEKLMQEELAYLEAKKSDLPSNPEVKKQIEEATRSILVVAYLDEKVDSKARPT